MNVTAETQAQPESQSQPQTQTKSGVSGIAILAYLLAAAFLCYEMALQVSPSVMTQDLIRDLGIDASGLGFIASVYFYSYTVMQIPVGLLFDRYSARLLITFAVFICACGALFFGLTSTLALAALGRFFMGIGSAFAFISVLVVAARYFPARFFALLVGIAQCLAALGAMMGEWPFALAVEHSSWRHVINVMGITGVALAILCWVVIRDRAAPHTKADEEKFDVMKSLRLIVTEPQTWWVGLYAFASWAPITAFPSTWGVAYIAKRYAITNSKAAAAVSMIWIGLAAASPVIGWLSDRIGRRNILLQVCGFIGLVATLAILYLPNVSFYVLYVLLFAFGIATAGQIISFAVVKDNNRPQVTATAIGFNNMAVVAGGVVFPYLVGNLMKNHWDGALLNNVPVYSVGDYQISLIVVPICFAITLISSLFFIKETNCKAKY